MKEFLGTPGEWQVDGTSIFCLNDDRDSCNRFYAYVQKGFVHVQKGWIYKAERPTDEEIDANVRVMAASKDLLAALQGMISEDFPSLPLSEQERRLNAADAAINKALG